MTVKKLTDHDAFKNQNCWKIPKNSQTNDLRDIANELELTYNQIKDRLDLKYDGPSAIGYTLPLGK